MGGHHAGALLLSRIIVKVTRTNHPVLEELFELLRSSRSHVGRHIIHIHLDGEWFDNEPSKSGLDYTRSSAISPYILQKRVVFLLRLHSLYLKNIRLVHKSISTVAEDDDILDIFLILHSFSSIGTLTLDFHYAGPPQLFRPIPDKLPALLIRDLCLGWSRPLYDFYRNVQDPDTTASSLRCTPNTYPIALRIVFDAYLATLRLPDVRLRPKLQAVIFRLKLYTDVHPIFTLHWDSMDRALTILDRFRALLPRTYGKGRLFFCIDTLDNALEPARKGWLFGCQRGQEKLLVASLVTD
ncbi:hypothetical protein BD413DRAFT_489525 [Trametes elegans]|nr:hypothetical protein BD413DRAFT_489525 [Trametes elegans]